jgi:hypothetical protein
MPKSFRDATGQVIALRVTCKTLLAFEQASGVPIGGVGNRLAEGRLGDVLLIAFHAQAEPHYFNVEALAAALETAEQINGLVNAVQEAVSDFFPKQTTPAADKPPVASPSTTPTSNHENRGLGNQSTN